VDTPTCHRKRTDNSAALEDRGGNTAVALSPKKSRDVKKFCLRHYCGKRTISVRYVSAAAYSYKSQKCNFFETAQT